MRALNGNKTYLVAAVTILFTGLQYWTGAVDANTAVLATLGALGLGGLRHGVSNNEPRAN